MPEQSSIKAGSKSSTGDNLIRRCSKKMGPICRILGVLLLVAIVTCSEYKYGNNKDNNKKLRLNRIRGQKLRTPAAYESQGYEHKNYERKTYQPKHVEKKEDYHKTLSCYQCAWSPGRTVYKTITYYDEQKVRDTTSYGGGYKTKQVRRTKQVPEEKVGGWGPCKGPFSRYQAKSYGIKSDKCKNNCFSRVDSNGNIYRGCYEGEWGVDPTKLGCHKQAGSLYCFCGKDNCNNKLVPKFEN